MNQRHVASHYGVMCHAITAQTQFSLQSFDLHKKNHLNYHFHDINWRLSCMFVIKWAIGFTFMKNKKNENLHNRVPITDEIREALKEKREKMHYSYNDVAELLGVHWSTYRKWELQETTHYSGLMEQKVIAYLNDELHGQINAADMAALEKLVNRQKSVFRLLSDDLKMQMKFFTDMEKLIDKTLDKYSSIHQSKKKKK